MTVGAMFALAAVVWLATHLLMRSSSKLPPIVGATWTLSCIATVGLGVILVVRAMMRL